MADKQQIPEHTVHVGDILTDYASCSVRVEKLEQGGFGLVAIGPDEMKNGTWIALKTVRPDLLRDSRVREAFTSEALNWVGLWPHDNVVRPYGLTKIDNVPFLQLTYAENGSLYDLLQRSTPPLTFGLLIAQMVAAGLAYLHDSNPQLPRANPLQPNMRQGRPIIHCDLSPKNVLVYGSSLFQITDLGLAKVAQVVGQQYYADMPLNTLSAGPREDIHYTVAGGNARYMAPEQWQGAAIGTEVDVYALGVIICEIFTQAYPYVFDSREGFRKAHETAHPRSLRTLSSHIPPQLDDLYQQCLSKDPKRRPTALDLLHGLQAIAESLGEEPYWPSLRTPRTPADEGGFWQNLAATCGGFELYESALAYSDRALAIDPMQMAALHTRATALQELGRVDEALEGFDRALAAIPPDNHLHRGVTLYNLALLLGHLELYAKAEAAYAEACKLTPANADLWFNRAADLNSWAQKSIESGDISVAHIQIQRALVYTLEALEQKPDWPQGQQLLQFLRRTDAQMRSARL